MNLFLFLLFLGFLWWGVIKYACTLEENKKEKESETSLRRMGEINKIILLCFKDYDDLFRYRRENMSRLERCCEGFRNGDTMYKLGLMNSSTICGLSVNEVFFVNCSIDECQDEDFKITLRVLEKCGSKVHYDPKDTEEFQEEL